MITALFVDANGPYKDVADCWGEERDARTFAGTGPVIAHPPCERWGRYWGGGPMLAGTPKQKKLGDDGGCFAFALAQVRRCKGVLEHPAHTHTLGELLNLLTRLVKVAGFPQVTASGSSATSNKGIMGIERARLPGFMLWGARCPN